MWNVNYSLNCKDKNDIKFYLNYVECKYLSIVNVKFTIDSFILTMWNVNKIKRREK